MDPFAEESDDALKVEELFGKPTNPESDLTVNIAGFPLMKTKNLR